MIAGEQATLRIDIPSLSGAMRAGTRCDVLSVFENRYGRETAHVRLEDGRVSLLATDDLTQTDEVTNDDRDEPTIDAPDGRGSHGEPRADDAGSPGDGNGDLDSAGAEPTRQPGVLADGSGPVSPADAVGHREPEARASIRAEARGIPAVVGETLGRCGFRLAARQFAEGKFYASREALKASWDVATERLSIWGTDRVLTLAEVEAEFGPRTEDWSEEQLAWLERVRAAGFVLGGPTEDGHLNATRNGKPFVVRVTQKVIWWRAGLGLVDFFELMNGKDDF